MTWHAQEPEDSLVRQAELISERLSRIALDMNVALMHSEGLAKVRLERAITGIDTTIKEVRLMATSQLRLGGSGVGRRPG